MRRPTNITIAGIVILIIIVICVVVFSGNKKQNTNNVETENTQISNNVINNSNTINENENVQNEVENTVNEEQVQNEIENPIENEVSNVAEQTEVFEETPRNAEEKALRIVENDWTGSDVAFSVNGMDANGNYIVQVTDANTTVLAFYTVNVGNGTFTKKEME